jgi:hypothetical protein
MSALLTEKTYAVHWDDPAELDTIGGPFRARLQTEPDGSLTRWNGWVCPHFERSEIDRYIEFLDAQPDNDLYERVSFDGDDLVFHTNEYHPEIARMEPTELGLYPLGAFSWTWCIVPPDTDPDE